MRISIIPAAAAAAFASLALMAQTANPKPPQVKSPKEAQAINAVFQATTVDARVAAANDLITKFADTQYKAIVLYVVAETYSQKGDADNMVLYAERVLEVDPKFYGAMLQIANGLASRTRKFDLDKEEKLSRAEKLCKQALELVDQTVKTNAQMTDEQFAAAKKGFMYQAHDTLGTAAMARENYELAVTEYNAALGLGVQNDPATMVRLGTALLPQKKFDEAIAAYDKALADPSAGPAVKKVATDEKIKAAQAKAAAAKQ